MSSSKSTEKTILLDDRKNEEQNVEYKSDVEPMKENDSVFHSQGLLLCCAGIVVFLATYGYLQEKIMTVPYDVDTTEECQNGKWKNCLFQHSIFLVIFNRLFPAVIAFFTLWIQSQPLSPGVPIWKYFLVSFSNVSATAARYEALKYLAFPTQMLGKSAKMVPVMCWSRLVGGKTFTWKSWMIAFACTGGWICYFLSGAAENKTKSEFSSGVIVIYGLFFMFCYLASDGFTSTLQEKLFTGNQKLSKYNQMAWVNTCAGVLSLVGILQSGKFLEAVDFCHKHPTFLFDVCILSASATAAQYVIYTTIKEYGAMNLAKCMNVRQIISIFLSFHMYGHTIKTDQIVSLSVVFMSLFMKQNNSCCGGGRYKGGKDKKKLE